MAQLKVTIGMKLIVTTPGYENTLGTIQGIHKHIDRLWLWLDKPRPIQLGNELVLADRVMVEAVISTSNGLMGTNYFVDIDEIGNLSVK